MTEGANRVFVPFFVTLSPMSDLRLSRTALADFDHAEHLEWLETNGRGGFAAQTVLGSQRRQYHGLSFFALKPPDVRALFLSRVDETLIIDGSSHALSTSRFENAVSPQGYLHLESFALDPFPVWTWRIGDVFLEKAFFLVHGKDEAILRYSVLSNPEKQPLSLELRPLLACRPIHVMESENPLFSGKVEEEKNALLIRPYDTLPKLMLSHNAKVFDGSVAGWHKEFCYAEERERGYNHLEDLYCVGALRYDLATGKNTYLTAAIGRSSPCTPSAVAAAEKKERSRRKALSKKTDDEFVSRLKRAADQFLVERGKQGGGIIAGYHWFTEYGRDAMISLPGLLLARGLVKEAKQVVLTSAANMSDGIIPNRFSDTTGKPEYNTVDATLWMFRATEQILAAHKDLRFLRKIIGKLEDSIRWHETGTHHGIRVDDNDGLLSWYAPGFSLTWMDAVVDTLVITPRMGKPVEVNALWYAALQSMHRFYKLLGARERAEDMSAKAERVKESFRRLFWNDRDACLYDCIDHAGNRVAELRPNQIFAVSLCDDLLTEEQQEAVLACVTREHLTPVGLRSLSPRDPHYIGVYEGGHLERDTAYHQGTTWGWLIGPYISAFLRVHDRNATAKKEARALLAGFEQHFHDACLGQLSEIFDGNAPHRPRGCVAQAWTVAEVLRIVEELGV